MPLLSGQDETDKRSEPSNFHVIVFVQQSPDYGQTKVFESEASEWYYITTCCVQNFEWANERNTAYDKSDENA